MARHKPHSAPAHCRLRQLRPRAAFCRDAPHADKKVSALQGFSQVRRILTKNASPIPFSVNTNRNFSFERNAIRSIFLKYFPIFLGIFLTTLSIKPDALQAKNQAFCIQPKIATTGTFRAGPLIHAKQTN
jgi:hypothetical protein